MTKNECPFLSFIRKPILVFHGKIAFKHEQISSNLSNIEKKFTLARYFKMKQNQKQIKRKMRHKLDLKF